MKSGCNSREFRIKYYAQKYTRTQKKIDAKRGTQIGKTRTATIKSMKKIILKTSLLLCIMLLGTATLVFADTASDANQPLKTDMEYEIDGSKVSVEIDSVLVSKLNAKTVYNLAKEHTQDSIKIVSEENLSQENLSESSELDLFVYANQKLVKFQVEKASADKLSVEEAKGLIEDSANSDSNNVHVYDVGSDSSNSTIGYKIALAVACVIIILLLGVQVRNKNKK